MNRFDLSQRPIGWLIILSSGALIFYLASVKLFFPVNSVEQSGLVGLDATELVAQIPENWQIFEHREAGFSLRYPLGWDIEAVVPHEIRFQPGGKRYFREPNNLYPLIVEVIEEDLPAISQRYPRSPIMLNDRVKVGGAAENILVEPISVPLIIKHTERKNLYLVFRSDIGAISLAETEISALRQTIMEIISTLEFFRLPQQP